MEKKTGIGNVVKTAVWKSISELLTNSVCSSNSGYLYCHPAPGLKGNYWCNPVKSVILSQGGCSLKWVLWMMGTVSSSCASCCVIARLQWNQRQPCVPRGAALVRTSSDLRQCSKVSCIQLWYEISNNDRTRGSFAIGLLNRNILFLQAWTMLHYSKFGKIMSDFILRSNNAFLDALGPVSPQATVADLHQVTFNSHQISCSALPCNCRNAWAETKWWDRTKQWRTGMAVLVAEPAYNNLKWSQNCHTRQAMLMFSTACDQGHTYNGLVA